MRLSDFQFEAQGGTNPGSERIASNVIENARFNDYQVTIAGLGEFSRIAAHSRGPEAEQGRRTLVAQILRALLGAGLQLQAQAL
jgi:hypothetical protein